MPKNDFSGISQLKIRVMLFRELIMKKIILGMFFALTVYTCFAHFPIYIKATEGNGAVDAEWSLIQTGIYPNEHYQLFSEKTEIFGLAMALGMLNQKSAIVSFAPINGVEKNYFMQAGLLVSVTSSNYALSVSPLLNLSGRNYGLQLGLLNLENNFGYRSSDDNNPVPGLQLGLFNSGGGLQIGILNWNPKGFLPCFPIFNFSFNFGK